VSPKTHAVYRVGYRAFLVFLAICGLGTMGDLPELTEEMLIYFVTYCNCQLQLRYTTIKTYLCGVRFMYLRNGVHNPWILGNMIRLESIVNAIKRQQGTNTHKRMPITFRILKDLCILLDNSVFTRYVDILVKAMFCVAFFAFLRCGEITCDKYDPTINLSLSSVTISSDLSTVYLLLRSSKTDPFRRGVSISLHRIQQEPICCPVKAILQYLAIRKLTVSQPHEPLFLTPDGHAVDRRFFIHNLKQLLHRAGYEQSMYNGHSFRIGAATSAASAQIPEHMIKTLGRWSSSCYNRYIRTQPQSIKLAQVAMASRY